jgi:hypothetical protein
MHEADIIWMMLEMGFHSGAPEDLALNNLIDQLLVNSQVVFDSESGTFKNVRPLIKEIALEGNGNILIWTQRMLQRVGFKVSSSNEAKFKVNCSIVDGKPNWKVTENNNVVFIVDSITELSRKILLI